jgi:hypothetical protein
MGPKTARVQEFQDLVAERAKDAGTFALPVALARAAAEKLDLGDEKYGPDSWRDHDMLAEAMGEVVDLYNYAYLEWLVLGELRVRIRLTSTIPDDPLLLFVDRGREAMLQMGVGALAWHAQVSLTARELGDAGIPRSLSGADLVGAAGPGGRG